MPHWQDLQDIGAVRHLAELDGSNSRQGLCCGSVPCHLPWLRVAWCKFHERLDEDTILTSSVIQFASWRIAPEARFPELDLHGEDAVDSTKDDIFSEVAICRASTWHSGQSVRL